ncbi:MAG TPA: hypothetical protein VJ890_20885 [Vineibacter sp.]|nr:hypothetical protein [Vineibacter sp.]
MRAALLLAAMAMMAAGSASACYAPREPSCLFIYKPDQTCARNVRQYLDEEKDYRKCVTDDAQTKLKESVERSKGLARKWNCLAEGNTFCW